MANELRDERHRAAAKEAEAEVTRRAKAEQQRDAAEKDAAAEALKVGD